MSEPGRPGIVTIDDVAAAAGVSVATVSRALRGLPNVAPATAERVRTVASALRYRPAPFAAGLAAGRTSTAAMAVPLLDSWYFAQVMAGAEAALSVAGYDLLVVAIDSEPTRHRVLRGPLVKRADGLILADVAVPADELDELRQARIEVVTLGFEMDGSSAVVVDDVELGRLATAHLLDLGHRDVALLGQSVDDPQGFIVPLARREGYLAALADAGVVVRPELEAPGQFTIEGGAQAIEPLLDLGRPPTAVFAMSDEMAAGAIRTIRERGLRVPEDISVMGVDDHEFASVIGLTTIRQPVARHGEVAVDLLLTRLRDPASAVQRVEVPFELVVRATTAPAGR